MKKLFLLITLVMSAVLGMKAERVDAIQLIAHKGDGALYDSQYGKLFSNPDYNEYYRWFGLTNLNSSEGWYVGFDKPIEVKAGDKFRIAFWGEPNRNVRNGKSYPDANDQGFNNDGDQMMTFSRDCKLNGVRFYWGPSDGNWWGMHVYVDDDKYEAPAQQSGKSNFALDVWDRPQTSADGYQPWDIAGGLYDPYATYHFDGRDQRVEGNYPLADRFRRTIGDKNFLNFCGPLTADEVTAYGDHAQKWAVKNGQESETELYVIDFCEGNDKRGLYINVPTVADMNLSDMGTDESKNNATPAFFRMGVRFGFIDLSFNESVSNHDDHLRFVKWGHCFRLNEQSRPLNAFPVLNDAKTEVTSFYDSYGQTKWNGKLADANANWQGDAVKDLKAVNNKEGDSRILAERNFWLKRIFLEVAYADDARKFKRFYIYFDGEYDLNGGSRSFAQDYYVSATGNYVDRTPNIFRGANLAAEEAGFHRFHNLNTETMEKYIGIDKATYDLMVLEGNYLYGLELTDPYAVESEYTAFDANGNVVKYTHPAGTEVTSKIHYTGFDGKFWEYVDGNTVGAPIASHEDEAMNAVVDAMATSMIYDPDGTAAATPTTVTVKSTYTFPNQAFPTVIEDEYPFVVEHATPETEFELKVTPVSRAADFTDFTCDVDWSHFGSMSLGSDNYEAAFAVDDVLPVSNYVLMVAGSESAETPADSEYRIVEINDGGTTVTLGHDNLYWAGNDDKNLKNHQTFFAGNKNGYYIHYKLLTSYNFCYPTTGILSSDLLYDNDGNPSELLSTTGLDGDINAARTVSTGVAHANANVEFRVAPAPVVARGYAFFDEKVQTGIEDVAADGTVAPAEYYSLQGVRVAQPQAGQVYIVRRGAVVARELAR